LYKNTAAAISSVSVDDRFLVIFSLFGFIIGNWGQQRFRKAVSRADADCQSADFPGQ
jgi:hypothetical protein